MASTRLVVAVVILVGAGYALAMGRAAQGPTPLLVCRHGVDTTDADRTRRAQALTLARAIHAEQGRVAQQTRTYQPLDRIGQLPPAPEGFALRFQTDGQSYLFAIKDTRDPCHYGIFSDQEGRLYESSPSVPQIAS